jgi:ATP-dependent exoDNAse (exonuclease V) beta subunit
LDQQFSAEQALATCDAYRSWIEQTFSPINQLVEVPFSHITAEGQQITGFIDHLIITDKGPVIIDHKSYQGKMSAYPDKATSYSGQLSLYQKVVEASYPDSPSPSTWIHFITTGSAIQVSS